MSNQKTEQKPIETVDVTLTVKLPTQYYKFLKLLGQLIQKTPEQILVDEVYADLKSFVNGGALESWLEVVMNKNKNLESLVEQVECQVLAE